MENLMLSEFITHLQETLSKHGDMPISKLSYFEDEDGEGACEVVPVCGFCVNEPGEGFVEERTLIVLDDEEVQMLEDQGAGDPEPTIQ